jgi:hypothetical protein
MYSSAPRILGRPVCQNQRKRQTSPSVFGPPKAISQLLWPDKDREERFSLGENHEKIFVFPGFPARGTHREQQCAAFFTESSMRFDGLPSSTGNPGSVYNNCEITVSVKVLDPLPLLLQHPLVLTQVIGTSHLSYQ